MDDDRTLVAAARRGDDGAWAVIYDRYADKLHDHCYRILRDREEAADALHDAFIAAARNLHQLRDPDRLRPWLYSICRHCSLKRLKARDRVELTDQPDDLMATDDDLGRGLAAAELGELVWAAAAGLNPRDQALLDLSVRQGLEGQDLADAMGTSLDNSYVMLSRMRDQVERSLGALLIARLGRDDCADLDALLAGWDGKFSPLLRKRVARHVDGCKVCTHKRSTVASPLALLALVPVVPAPSILKGRVISSIRNWEVHDGPPIKFNKDGFPVPEGGDVRRRPGAAWILVVAAALLLFGGFLFAGRDDGDRDVSTAAGSVRDRERVTTTTAGAATTTTDGAGSVSGDATSTSLDGAAPSTTAPGSPTTKPGSPTTTVAGGPTTTAPPSGVVVSDATFTPRSIRSTTCASGPYTVTVTAPVSGNPSKVRMVIAGPTDSENAIVAMTANGDGTWTGTFGNFSTRSAVNTVAFEVQAFEAGKQTPGKKRATVSYEYCEPTTIPTQTDNPS